MTNEQKSTQRLLEHLEDSYNVLQGCASQDVPKWLVLMKLSRAIALVQGQIEDTVNIA